MAKTKLAKSAGRFGIRYGVSLRRRIADIESKQRKKQKCIFCKGRAKRISKGIWLCRKCGKKFAGHAYYLEQSTQDTLEEKIKEMEKSKSKSVKKNAKVLNKEKSELKQENKEKKEENKKSKKTRKTKE
jgi:large subunit ribosomal protein L37Ae